jgi:anaerobic selenocysteine-containing dehydrogenase
MEEIKTLRTACRSCHGGCGVMAHVKDGKVIKVEGDPNFPISHGTQCSKGLAITQLAYHPDRILYPIIFSWHFNSSFQKFLQVNSIGYNKDWPASAP